ncbi:tRNA pseudouridine(55) synthase TruB [Desulfovibrionales bacterium]
MTQRTPCSQRDGVLVLHKPGGLTSTDCLNRIKRRLGQKKIGHAGTLDPMATGVLLVLLGQATKLATYVSAEQKTYRGCLILGQESDTYDIQGQVRATRSWEALTPEAVAQEVLAWKTHTSQEVPPVSAAKHQGKPLYALHRAGKETPVKIKEISIFDVEILTLDLPQVCFRVTCSAGTYIRSLAHSLGIRLGCGAVLSELEREASHPFTLAQAHSLDAVLEYPEQLDALVIPLDKALPHWPKIRLTAEQETVIKHGGYLPVALFSDYPAQDGDKALLLASSQAPLALAEVKDRENILVWTILRGLWA